MSFRQSDPYLPPGCTPAMIDEQFDSQDCWCDRLRETRRQQLLPLHNGADEEVDERLCAESADRDPSVTCAACLYRDDLDRAYENAMEYDPEDKL